MGKVTAIRILSEDNPRASKADITMYANRFAEYCEAQANIGEHGAIVFHPRTGAPIENPYLAVRDRSGAALSKTRLRVDRLWELMESGEQGL